jgi:antitoxin VapB
MALNIESDLAHGLARELAKATGQSLTDAVTSALRQSLETVKRTSKEADLMLAEVAAVQRFVANLPDRDVRGADEVLGYDAFGVPR